MSTTSENPPTPAAEPATFIPLCEPSLRGNEWKYVQECLNSGWVSSVGSFVNRFEEETARYVGVDYAVATVNGTSALHTALLVAGVEPEDEVLVSTLTFIASVNAIRYIGAHPVLIDAEPRYWQMDPNLVESFLTEQCVCRNGQIFNRQTGRRVRAIVPVHILGHPVRIDVIGEIAARFGLKVVEDAAEALGASYQDRKVGSHSDVVCFSFNGNKTITSGAGGMIVTKCQQKAEKARYLTTQAKDDAVEYVHNEVGYNYRMCNVLAAMGLAQLEQLDDMVSIKRQIAQRYTEQLKQPGIHWFQESPRAFSTCWLSTAFIDPAVTGITAVELRRKLQDHRIQTRRLWRPMHTNPPYAQAASVLTGVANRITENCLSFPSSTSLTETDQRRVCQTTRSLISAMSGSRRAA